ncbi:hypothetical protein [uncultured Sphaerochaeta sp.]|uniref:hypothetical protein n=1 Tax=uncultured Sphaerochaeta sp. TaxID=886478 RepID=UPI002A0A9753|nr:hypothetical protein [uncultured Sphaerochaeta sp.]
MNRFSEDGFILDYLVTPVVKTPYFSKLREKDQLKLEMLMRKDVVTIKQKTLPENYLKIQDWTPRYSYANIFLDCSSFYSTPQRISFSAATSIFAEKEKNVELSVWTYMSLGLYHDGNLVLTISPPRYKPIRREKVSLSLHEGQNTFVIQAENLGVRDTYNLFGIQVLPDRAGLSIRFPIPAFEEKYRPAIAFLDNLTCQKSRLVFSVPAPKGTSESYPDVSPEYHPDYIKPCTDISQQSVFEINNEYSQADITCCGLSRRVQVAANISSLHMDIPDKKERNDYIFKKIAQVKTLDRGDHGFSIFNILARKALNIEASEDRKLLLDDLDLIDRRVDCSDFILSGLIRYLHNYSLDNEVAEKARDVFLSYRYWMDMEGQDGMCFWSENHSLMFYFCAYEIGKMYPDDFFEKAMQTGKQLSTSARTKLSDWLDDVYDSLFEEFLSAVYMCVTFAALLNVYDYAEKELSSKAEAILDIMIAQLGLQVFDGAVIAPMGRVYRDCLFPFRGAANSILALEANGICYDYAEGWTSFFATSKYQFKAGLENLIRYDQDTSYTTGNARIFVKKTADYILTSVASPRRDNFERFENTILSGHADLKKHSYTKSMNERFHGTSCFQSGCYGYQQHLWYAALSSEAVFFMNHPGASCEQSSLRPGYWHGNGIFPALRQEGSLLGGIFCIPDNHPIHFVHAYLPHERFDEVNYDGPWIFCRKEKGYLAFWCPVARLNHDDMLFDCEIRYKADQVPFLVIVGSKQEHESFPEFLSWARAYKPEFSFPDLYVGGKEFLTFREYTDNSQIID